MRSRSRLPSLALRVCRSWMVTASGDLTTKPLPSGRGQLTNRNDLYERNIKHTDSKTADDICNHEIRLMILIFNKVFHNKKLTLKEMYNELNLIYDTQLYKYNWLVTMRNNLKASVGGMEND